MATQNPNSLDGQGQFHARVAPAKPLARKWHKPGNEKGNDALPEYHAQTFPPGTAPKETAFRPNPNSNDISQANSLDAMHENGYISALDMPGPTSKDIYNSIDVKHGRPIIGQTSREIRGAHSGKRKKERCGLEGVGASKNNSVFDKARHQVAGRDNAKQAQRGNIGEREDGMAAGGAESLPPVRAEAREVRQGPHGRTAT